MSGLDRRGFLGLLGVAAAAPALAIGKSATTPVAELGVAAAAEAALGGYLVPADFFSAVLTGVMTMNEARAELCLPSVLADGDAFELDWAEEEAE